jgi:hypothetical protein
VGPIGANSVNKTRRNSASSTGKPGTKSNSISNGSETRIGKAAAARNGKRKVPFLTLRIPLFRRVESVGKTVESWPALASFAPLIEGYGGELENDY